MRLPGPPATTASPAGHLSATGEGGWDGYLPAVPCAWRRQASASIGGFPRNRPALGWSPLLLLFPQRPSESATAVCFTSGIPGSTAIYDVDHPPTTRFYEGVKHCRLLLRQTHRPPPDNRAHRCMMSDHPRRLYPKPWNSRQAGPTAKTSPPMKPHPPHHPRMQRVNR